MTSNASAANVEWQAPSTCTVDQFSTRIELVLGRPLADVTAHDVRVEVTEELPTHWQLTFTLVANGIEQGRREIHGESCADVSRAGAVAAAMALQAQAATPAKRADDAPAAAPQGESEPPPVPLPQGPSRPQENAQPRFTVSGAVGANLVGDAGTLAKPTLGVSADLGLRVAQVLFGITGLLLPAIEHEVSTGRGGEFGLIAGGLFTCVRPVGERWLAFGCVHYELGQLSGRGTGSLVTESWSRSALWQALRPELGLALPLVAGLEIQLRVGVSIALVQPEFVLDGELVALKPERLIARAALGFAYVP